MRSGGRQGRLCWGVQGTLARLNLRLAIAGTPARVQSKCGGGGLGSFLEIRREACILGKGCSRYSCVGSWCLYSAILRGGEPWGLIYTGRQAREARGPSRLVWLALWWCTGPGQLIGMRRRNWIVRVATIAQRPRVVCFFFSDAVI